MDKQDNGFIYTQFCGRVSGYVHSRVSDPAEAEDLVQTVFLKVYANLSRYDAARASLSTWIYTITRNTVYDHLKEKRDRPVQELPEDTADTGEEPLEGVLDREMLEELADALEQLPRQQRDIIILLYYKNLTRKNVAEMFGITYGQLRYLHDKAIQRLGELLHIK